MKRGIRVLGLAVMVAALGAMVLGGGSALGQFLINLSNALLATITGTQIGSSSLLVPARSLEVECHELNVNEGKINTQADASFKIIFSKMLIT